MEKYNIRDLLFEELIELTLEAEDFEDAIKKIGEDAYRKGYVKEGFADAVIKREKLYLIPWKGIRLRNRQSSLQS